MNFTNISKVMMSLDVVGGLLDQGSMLVEEMSSLPSGSLSLLFFSFRAKYTFEAKINFLNDLSPKQGKVQSLATKALFWLRDLAEDELEWNRTMGTTLDFYTTPIEEESGVLCAYQYFHTLYVIEWYYDYIGYDYYDEDFNFYYYDDIGISGSGSGEYKMLHYGYHDFLFRFRRLLLRLLGLWRLLL